MIIGELLQETASEDAIRKRIMTHVAGSNPDSCWVWRKSHRGDGQFYLTKDEVRNFKGAGEGKCVSARRLMYLLTYREIPNGKQVKTTCMVRGCVNPNHLVLKE
jgi:hypothetical protein